jgi:predicted MFS family arabinose efflux permease
MGAATAREEWAKYWILPVAAAIGYSANGLPIYGMGPFVGPLHKEFGWSSAQTLSGQAIVSAFVALTSVLLGTLVDRLGPRRVGLIGVLAAGAAAALLSMATGTLINWLALWMFVAIATSLVQLTVWTTAVVSRFDAARGMAIGVTLSGTSLGLFSLPLLSTWLVNLVGWRYAFVGLGGIFVLVQFPLLLLFFRSAQDSKVSTRRESLSVVSESGLTLAQALRKPTFYKLTFASGFFAIGLVGTVVNFVPILTSRGAKPMAAAGAASLIGVFSLVGRLTCGAALDRIAGHIVGAISFLIPILGCVLLLSDRASPSAYLVAAATFGLTFGAETDAIVYIALQKFGRRKFGTIQGALVCAIALGAAVGPISAGSTFDKFGSYAPFLICTMALMLTSSALIWSVGKAQAEPKLA